MMRLMKMGFVLVACAVIAGGLVECAKQLSALKADNRALKSSLEGLSKTINENHVATRNAINVTIAAGESNTAKVSDLKKSIIGATTAAISADFEASQANIAATACQEYLSRLSQQNKDWKNDDSVNKALRDAMDAQLKQRAKNADSQWLDNESK